VWLLFTSVAFITAFASSRGKVSSISFSMAIFSFSNFFLIHFSFNTHDSIVFADISQLLNLSSTLATPRVFDS
jgi:hypothetical protein